MAVDYLTLLPHALPMRLIEIVVLVEPGQRAVCRRTTRGEDFFFQGHFPDAPVVPAVVLIELLAQTGGLAAGAPVPGKPIASRALRVAGVDGFRFPAACGVGVTLEAAATITGHMGTLYKIEGTVTASGVLVARGSLTLADVQGDVHAASG